MTLHTHPRLPYVAVVSEADYSTLVDPIANDRRLDALGRGYYSGLGGELSVWTAPDWTCDPTTVALLRARATLLDSWARPLTRALTRLLSPHAVGTQ